MELQVTQENLNQAVSNISRVASNKNQLPILNNILFRTDNNRLLIAATNLEIASTQYIGAKIIKPGAITIPAKLISEFIANLPNQNIDLKVKNNNLYIKCGNYTSTINGYIADEFPELPTINEKSSVKYIINIDDFKQAVNQTIITTSNDNTRPILSGVYWNSFEDNLYLAATDGYRLSERKLLTSKTNLEAVIPNQTLQEVLHNITNNSTEVEVLFDETQVRFRLDENEIISRLIDGSFPNYRQLIPKKSQISIILNKDEFIQTIKVASLFARSSGGSITLTADKSKNELQIHSITSEVGENTSKIEAKITEDGEITLNSRYLNEALNVIDGDEVELGFNNKLSPCILKSTNKDNNYYHIIMPLKS